ncbi:MAG TPA: hypothetical protein VHC40_06025 [Rhizomicrobium sp.]|nr:hypothetical protein [Rhizomicrobium sp.]
MLLATPALFARPRCVRPERALNVRNLAPTLSIAATAPKRRPMVAHSQKSKRDSLHKMSAVMHKLSRMLVQRAVFLRKATLNRSGTRGACAGNTVKTGSRAMARRHAGGGARICAESHIRGSDGDARFIEHSIRARSKIRDLSALQ